MVVLNDRADLFHVLDNSTYVALTRSAQQLVIFHAAQQTSQQELLDLQASIRTQCNVHVLQRPAYHLGLERAAAYEQRMQKRASARELLYVHQLFTYTSHRVLQPLARLFRTTTHAPGLREHIYEEGRALCVPGPSGLVHVQARDETLQHPQVVNVDGMFEKSFEVSGGMNCMDLVAATIRMLVEFHYTRAVPQRVTTLRPDASETLGCTLLTKAWEQYNLCPPYDGNRHTLPMYIPCITLWCTVLDAVHGFPERLSSMSNWSIAQCQAVHRRTLRILALIDAVLEKSPTARVPPTAFHRRCSKKVPGTTMTVCGRPTLRVGTVGVQLIHRCAESLHLHDQLLGGTLCVLGQLSAALPHQHDERCV